MWNGPGCGQLLMINIVPAQADFLDEELEDGEAMSDDEILNEKGFSEL